MNQNRIIDEIKLDNWVRNNPILAQGKIPELISRLVSSLIPKPDICRIPYGDAVNQPGYDGRVETIISYPPYVPEGISYWEIGTGIKPRDKATEDYTKRTLEIPEEERKNSTYVFVFPLSSRNTDWPYTWKPDGQLEWVKKRCDEHKWKNVKVIDGTQLVEWLNHYSNVERWIAKEMGFPADDLETPEERWDSLHAIGDPPPLTPHIFLTNRQNACKKLEEFFSGSINFELKIETNYLNQISDFVTAYLANFGATPEFKIVGHCLIIKTLNAWEKAISLYDEPHFFIADFDFDNNNSQITKLLTKTRMAGHSIIYGGSPGGIPHPNFVQIPNPSPFQIQKALESSGYSETKAYILAQKCDRNLNTLLRLLSNFSCSPLWAQNTDAADLSIAELLGSWDESRDNDRRAAEEISGNVYGEWIQKIRNQAFQKDTPLTHHDNVWKFVARYEGWFALGPRIFDEHLDNFQIVSIKVLGEKDPKFELPSSKRFAATIYDKNLSYSHNIRLGLAESIALLGTHSDALTNCSLRKRHDGATIIVREILKDSDWIMWASLNDLLPLLAEAAPNEFIKAIEFALNSDPCPFDLIFAQENKEVVGVGNYMTGLLWALELLAWDPEFLSRVVIILGELAVRDPGGNWENRPKNSLKTIFLPWLPQTCATIDKRKIALETLIQTNPNIAWNLFIDLLPGSTNSSVGSYRPKWRETIPETYSNRVNRDEYISQISVYIDLTLGMAKTDIAKLAEIIENFEKLPSEIRDQILTFIISEEITQITDDEKNLLWTTLLKIVNKHKNYKDAKWAMSPEYVDKLSELSNRLKPENPFFYNQRLFTERSLGLYTDGHNYSINIQKLEDDRKQAVFELMQIDGVSTVIEFAKVVESPWYVGMALGMISDNNLDSEIIPELIDCEIKSVSLFTSGFIIGKFRIQNFSWVDNLQINNWNTNQLSSLLAFLPFNSDTWSRVAILLGEDESLYWEKANTNPHDETNNIELGIEKLIQFMRPIEAIRCFSALKAQQKELKPDLIIRTLNAILKEEFNLTQLDQYTIIELIKDLQNNPTTKIEDIYLIEWKFLPVLDKTYGASPKFLWQRLSDEPNFFCEIIQTIFRSKNEPEIIEEHSEEKKKIIINSYNLLKNWETPPGLQKDGSFDVVALSDWLNFVKEETSKSGHLDIAMISLGEVLIHAPPDLDGFWIHHSVAKILNGDDADKIRKGFETGIFNSRGVIKGTRGEEERKLEEEYREKAEDVESQGYYRFAVTLRDISDMFREEAEREENDDLYVD